MTLGALVVFQPLSAHAAAKGSLTKHDRALLATAIANGDKTVTLLIAAQKGANSKVNSGIASLGGTVRYREDDIDYIRASVPTDKVQAAAQLAGVQSLALDEVIPLEDTDPGPNGAVDPTPQTPPSLS